MPIELLYDGTDMYINLADLADSAAPTVMLTGVDCAAQIYDSDGNAVGGSIDLADQGGGLYRGILADTVALAVGDLVDVEITADDGADRKGTWRFPARYQYQEL